MSLSKLLQALGEGETSLNSSLLYDLSDLAPAEVSSFMGVWKTLAPERRRGILNDLVELTQDSPELDFSAVFRRCLSDEDAGARRKAIEGLWEHEERQIISPLCNLLGGDPSPAVRAAAATGLGKFANLAQEGKLLRKDRARIEASLLSTLENEDEDLEARRRALESVAVFNTGSVAEYIRWAYRSDNPALRCSALYAMGKTGEARWLADLVKETRNPSAAMRYEAANACGEIEEEEAIPYLIPLTQDDDLQVQLSAIRAIGLIGGPLAKKALRRCIKQGDSAVEDTARECLDMVNSMDDALTFKYSP